MLIYPLEAEKLFFFKIVIKILRYINFARLFKPKLTEEAAEYLVSML
jgi:hypothetical protein